MTERIQELINALGGDPTRWNQGDHRASIAWFRGIARQMGAKVSHTFAEPCDTFSACGFDLQGSTRYLLRLHAAPYAMWSTNSKTGMIDPCAAPIRAHNIDYNPATLLDEPLQQTRFAIAEWVEMGCDRASLLTWFHPNSRPSVAEVCFNNYD